MPVIIKKNQKLKDLADIQNDLTKILKEGKRKGEDQEDEVYSYSCTSTLYICV